MFMHFFLDWRDTAIFLGFFFLFCFFFFFCFYLQINICTGSKMTDFTSKIIFFKVRFSKEEKDVFLVLPHIENQSFFLKIWLLYCDLL